MLGTEPDGRGMRKIGNSREKTKDAKRIVIALGGNAIIDARQKGTSEEQLQSIRAVCKDIVESIKEGHQVIITHGNGPQIGNLLNQHKESKDKFPMLPMYLYGAMTQVQIGYMLQQELMNRIKSVGIDLDVVTIITQVLVDIQASAFENPAKPIGPFYDRETKEHYAKEKGYAFMKVTPEGNRPFRRAVPSPYPLRILEEGAIKKIVDAGIILVACGGGGIPVTMGSNGNYHGVNAVIDKDLSGAILAEVVGADILIIITNVEKTYLNFGTANQKALDLVGLQEAKNYLRQGQFSAGSMAPKVEACIRFLVNGGEKAIITALDKSCLALKGKTGTHFVREICEQ